MDKIRQRLLGSFSGLRSETRRRVSFACHSLVAGQSQGGGACFGSGDIELCKQCKTYRVLKIYFLDASVCFRSDVCIGR